MNTSETSQSIHEQIVALLPRLRRFARNLARNPHDADDVVQIAVERALMRLDQWQSGARLDCWMFKIVRNAWIDELRARGRRDKIFLVAEAGDNIGTDSMARETDLLSVQSAMARLPEDQREAVSLVLVEGLRPGLTERLRQGLQRQGGQRNSGKAHLCRGRRDDHGHR